jgi:hypothetical protein
MTVELHARASATALAGAGLFQLKLLEGKTLM